MNTALQINRINSAIYRLNQDISQPLNAAELAAYANYSEQHFHRLFRQITGESVNVYTRRIRLETAANQLMFDPSRAVIDIAQKCGFQSLSSFCQAFKKHFNCPPGQWRTEKIAQKKPAYLDNSEIAAAYQRLQEVSLPEVNFVELPSRRVAYLRHTGYDRGIKNSWLLLQAWAKHCDLPFDRQYGLHHSNPVQTSLEKCRYVACLEIDRRITRHGLINEMQIPGGLHAKFEFCGRYGELLPLITKVQQQWLPKAGLVAKTTPAFVHYRKNHFLAVDQRFELAFFLPVSFF